VWITVQVYQISAGQRILTVRSVSSCPPCWCLSWDTLGTLATGVRVLAITNGTSHRARKRSASDWHSTPLTAGSTSRSSMWSVLGLRHRARRSEPQVIDPQSSRPRGTSDPKAVPASSPRRSARACAKPGSVRLIVQGNRRRPHPNIPGQARQHNLSSLWLLMAKITFA
jgi:hypothetical protein